jgi:hypothetical protein
MYKCFLFLLSTQIIFGSEVSLNGRLSQESLSRCLNDPARTSINRLLNNITNTPSQDSKKHLYQKEKRRYIKCMKDNKDANSILAISSVLTPKAHLRCVAAVYKKFTTEMQTHKKNLKENESDEYVYITDESSTKGLYEHVYIPEYVDMEDKNIKKSCETPRKLDALKTVLKLAIKNARNDKHQSLQREKINYIKCMNNDKKANLESVNRLLAIPSALAPKDHLKCVIAVGRKFITEMKIREKHLKKDEIFLSEYIEDKNYERLCTIPYRLHTLKPVVVLAIKNVKLEQTLKKLALEKLELEKSTRRKVRFEDTKLNKLTNRKIKFKKISLPEDEISAKYESPL